MSDRLDTAIEAAKEATAPRGGRIDMTHVNAELLSALAKAQANARTVGKRGDNKYGRYSYATADDMIAEGRRCRAEFGLSLVSVPNPGPLLAPSNDGEWVCCRVRIDWHLAHEAGGYMSGSMSIDAMGSKRRPPDKAVMAAATYAEGFLERSLMRLSRDKDGADDVDQREDREDAPAADSRVVPLGNTEAVSAAMALLQTGKISDASDALKPQWGTLSDDEQARVMAAVKQAETAAEKLALQERETEALKSLDGAA